MGKLEEFIEDNSLLINEQFEILGAEVEIITMTVQQVLPILELLDVATLVIVEPPFRTELEI